MSLFPTTQLRQLAASFRPHERLLAGILACGLIIGAFGLAAELQGRVSTEVPVQGGTYTEGIVGFARYVNPVLANTSPDRDLTRLIYAGLMKRSADGGLQPDLAADMAVSDNQQTYTFRLDPNASFHDGHLVRAEDVVFTIRAIKNPQVDSPRRAQWQNVSVTAVNDTTVRFNLPESFAGLPENATVGVLPKHLWQDTTGQAFAFSQLNTRPVGAGPYEVADVQRNADGVPTQFRLQSFSNYAGRQPHISTLVMQSFADNQTRRQAYEDGRIQGMPSVDPAYAKRLQQAGHRVTTHQFNRVFSVFFNENRNDALVDQAVRRALSESIPKARIVDSAVAGFGQPVNSPLPPSLAADATTTTATGTSSPSNLLETADWTVTDGALTKDNENLEITLTTADIPSLRKAANLIASTWRDLGIAVDIQTLPSAELTQDVVRPRDFEALLFGQSVSTSRDLYSFWHSSRQEDPGLNLAQYTNSTADGSLKDLRSATSSQQIKKLTSNFLTEIDQDVPAGFVFSPSFIYVLPENLGNVAIPPITQPADRFASVSNWYTDTQLLWNVFVDEEDQGKDLSNQ